jgi:hypothetical protein
MPNFIRIIYLFIFVCIFKPALAQLNNESIFRHVEIRTDTMIFNTARNTISQNSGNKYLAFIYNDENEVAEVTLMFKRPEAIESIILQPSDDFIIIDSLYSIGNQYKFKVRFKNLTYTEFLKFVFIYTEKKESQKTEELKLLPCTNTNLTANIGSDELFIGEEKIIDLYSNNPDNIRLTNEWVAGAKFDYRLEGQDQGIKLIIIPKELGIQKISLHLQVRKPFYNILTNQISYDLEPLELNINVKTSRLKFITPDRREITLDDVSRRDGIEVIMDYAKHMEMNKTYRLENQEQPGGTLIAEVYTRSQLANNRILCILRAYNYHRMANGYLFVKDGDNPCFITNLNIIPKTSINKISILREGRDWVQDLSLYPGETVDLKIEGESLHRARFLFEDLIDVTTDTLIRNESEVIYKLKVPINISKKKLNIYNNTTPTGFYLNIREFEEPRAFDYIYINYGDVNRIVSGIHGPILYDKGIRDVMITFNTDRIDDNTRLYGRQHLQIEIRITGPKNELIDMRILDNIIVCPSDRSPRYAFYDKRNCTTGEISINKYLRKNTNDLDDWSRINIIFRHNPAKYGVEGQQKEIEIVLKKNYKVDVDVSFPAGLITVSRDPENQNNFSYSNLYGISMAMVAQLSFYHPEKIAKLRPYKVGAGFLALDAFNFQSDKQDLAFVVLGSIYPSTRDRKLYFPLYIGGGYQFKSEKWMLLIGPGISVRL